MRKTTNMEEIRKTALAFLNLDISGQNSEFYPTILQHPFFNTALVPIENEGEKGVKFADVTTQEGLNLARMSFEKHILQANLNRLIVIVNKPYRMAFLKHIKTYLSKEDFSKLLRTIWIDSENPSQDPNVSVRTLVSWFKGADKQFLMTEKEYAAYTAFPEKIEIFRGVAVGRNPDGLSWTPKREVAEWFAHRFDKNDRKGYIKKATIRKENVLAYFLTESEVVACVRELRLYPD